jgi:polyisoprenoid-binding protein YceI
VVGDVTLAGTRQPQQLDVVVARGERGSTISVRGELVQTAFGIKPYSGLLGALKVRDMVEIRAEVSLPLS